MEQIGVFRIAEDQKRVRYAECPKYDEWREVKAGDYPVYLYTERNHKASTVSVWFGGDFSEVWHGFIMGKQDNFIPAEGWKVHRYQFQSFDGHMIDTADIVREEA